MAAIPVAPRPRSRSDQLAVATRNIPLPHACYHGIVQTQLTSNPGETASSADQQSQHGLDLLAEGNWHASAEAFRAAIAADPSHIEAHHGLIRVLGEAGQFESAVAAALALTVLTPLDPLAHTSLSIALQKAGHIPEAESAAARARILEWKQLLSNPETTPSNEAF